MEITIDESDAVVASAVTRFDKAQLRQLPSTFEKRGVAIGLTTPSLDHCRIRRGYRDQLDLVIPNLAGGRGVYIIAWQALSELVSLTVHDRVLHSEVLRLQSVTPAGIRDAVLGVAARGLAGPAAAAAATKAASDARADISATNFALLIRVACTAGGLSPQSLTQVGRADSEEAVRAALRRVAVQLRITPAELDIRIEGLSSATAPIGASATAQAGPLLRAIATLDRFCQAMDAAASEAEQDDTRSDEAAIGRFCGQVGRHTLVRCRAIVDGIAPTLANVVETVAAWPGARREIEEAAVRLAWLLDGWQPVCARWADRGSDAGERIGALADILQSLPLLPADEIGRNAADGTADQHSHVLTLRPVRELQDWRHGRMVVDLVARIEAAKAKALAA